MKFDRIRHLKRVGQRKHIATTNTNKSRIKTRNLSPWAPYRSSFYRFVNLMDPGSLQQDLQGLTDMEEKC